MARMSEKTIFTVCKGFRPRVNKAQDGTICKIHSASQKARV